MSKHGEHILKRKDGRWEARLSITDPDGKKKRLSFYGKSYKLAKEARSEYMKKFQEGIQPVSPAFNLKKVTVQEVVDYWLQCAFIRVKTSTYYRYLNSMEKYILPVFSSIRYMDLTTKRINQEIQKLLKKSQDKEKGSLSKKSIRDIFSLFKSALRQYNMDHFLRDHCLGFPLPKADSPSIRILSISEQKKLGHYLRTDVDSMKLGVYVALHTGLRLGELCGLKWNSIDLDKKTITITQSAQRQSKREMLGNSTTSIVMSLPKSNSSIRVIPLSNHLFRVLSRYSAPPLSSSYLLSEDPIKPMDPRTFQNRFKRMLELLDIENIRVHALRHTFATNCLTSGIDAKTLSRILGHKDVTITLKVYMHVTHENLAKQMMQLVDLSDEA